MWDWTGHWQAGCSDWSGCAVYCCSTLQLHGGVTDAGGRGARGYKDYGLRGAQRTTLLSCYGQAFRRHKLGTLICPRGARAVLCWWTAVTGFLVSIRSRAHNNTRLIPCAVPLSLIAARFRRVSEQVLAQRQDINFRANESFLYMGAHGELTNGAAGLHPDGRWCADYGAARICSAHWDKITKPGSERSLMIFTRAVGAGRGV